jgi:oligoribonuclease (3'-5' exoribonuclease)
MVVDIQTVSIAIASSGVFLAAIYYILQIRHQTTIRKTDLLIRLYSTMSSSEFLDAEWKILSLQIKDYEDYVEQYGSVLSENPMHKALALVASFYELLGNLLLRKLIDISSVYDVMGSNTPKMLYEKIKPIVLGARRNLGESVFPNSFRFQLA